MTTKSVGIRKVEANRSEALGARPLLTFVRRENPNTREKCCQENPLLNTPL
jgi:hypothetical protein